MGGLCCLLLPCRQVLGRLGVGWGKRQSQSSQEALSSHTCPCGPGKQDGCLGQLLPPTHSLGVAGPPSSLLRTQLSQPRAALVLRRPDDHSGYFLPPYLGSPLRAVSQLPEFLWSGKHERV